MGKMMASVLLASLVLGIGSAAGGQSLGPANSGKAGALKVSAAAEVGRSSLASLRKVAPPATASVGASTHSSAIEGRSSMLLFGAGLMLLGGILRRRKGEIGQVQPHTTHPVAPLCADTIGSLRQIG